MFGVVWLRAGRGWRSWGVVSQLRILIISPLTILLGKEVIVIVVVPVVVPLESSREIVNTTFIIIIISLISAIPLLVTDTFFREDYSIDIVLIVNISVNIITIIESHDIIVCIICSI
jgi:hypothetical protein